MPSADGQDRTRSFVADLHPWAVRFNLRPHLQDVSLANILAGDTCAPISLADFENTSRLRQEYTVENLQFIVWYQDFKTRFSRVSEDSDRNWPPSAATPTSTLSFQPLLKHNEKSPDSTRNSFEIECSRIIATFFSPGASKELTLDETLRDNVIRAVSQHPHPDAFRPAYEEIYRMVELCSVPRFLSIASTNINLSKQIYWYVVGVANILVGLALALVLIMMLPTPPQHNRAYRIFAIGFMSYGSADMYSAWRGFCSQVWMRGNAQLRVWELQEMDEEAKSFVHRVCLPSEAADPAKRNATELPSTKSETSFTPSIPNSIGKANLAFIAPFEQEPPTPVTPDLRDVRDKIPLRALLPADKRELHFHRPPIFGPETVIQDPRIKSVHRQVMYEVTCWGVCNLLIFSAIIFSVPGRVHR